MRWLAAGACAVGLLVTAACGRSAGTTAVPGAWTWVASGHTVTCAACAYAPVAVDVSVAGGIVAPFPEGSALDVKVSVADIGQGPIVMRRRVALPVEVVPDAGGPPLWTGDLPALPARWSGDGYLSFVWRARDSAGHSLPAGAYRLELRLPLTIDYSAGGSSGQEMLREPGDPAAGETFSVLLRIA